LLGSCHSPPLPGHPPPLPPSLCHMREALLLAQGGHLSSVSDRSREKAPGNTGDFQGPSPHTSSNPTTALLPLRCHLGFVQNRKVKVAYAQSLSPEETAVYSLVPCCFGHSSSSQFIEECVLNHSGCHLQLYTPHFNSLHACEAFE
jgi:hypothetical protein